MSNGSAMYEGADRRTNRQMDKDRFYTPISGARENNKYPCWSENVNLFHMKISSFSNCHKFVFRYEYVLAREYNWNVKNKASKGYEETYFFVLKPEGVFYNELETR